MPSCSFVHGRLPYENLKPDPVLKSLLSSLPIRKVVSLINKCLRYSYGNFCVHLQRLDSFVFIAQQIFTNADKVHAIEALSRLGLEDCFEGIICFETLNPTHKSTASDDEDDIEFLGSKQSPNAENGTPEIFDIIGYFSQPDAGSSGLPKTPIVCKPSVSAIDRALKIANIDPHRTVGSSSIRSSNIMIPHNYFNSLTCAIILILSLQLFFEDSVRNIQSGKLLGLNTVLVSS